MNSEILVPEAPSTDPIVLWLLAQFAMEEGGDLPVRLILGHLNQHDMPARMGAFKVSAHTDAAAKTIAAQLRYQAKADAATRGGAVQRYSIVAEWPNGTTSYTAFSEQSAQSTSDDLSLTETPDPVGLIKQLMRHLEVQTRLGTRAQIQQQNDQLRRESQLMERLERMESDRMAVIQLTEDMLDRRAERQQEAEKQAAAEERKERIVSELLGVVPIIKAKVAGHLAAGHAPGSEGMQREAEHQLMASLFEGMGVEDLRGLMAQLPPGKQAQLITLYKHTMGLQEETPPPAVDDGDKQH